MGPKEWKSYMPSMSIKNVAKSYVNAEGKIPRDKVIDVLRVSGLTIYGGKIALDKPSEVDVILTELGDGPYSVEELESWHANHAAHYTREQDEIEKVIAAIVSNNLVDGKTQPARIHMDRLKTLLTTFGDKLDPAQYDRIMKGVPQEADGFGAVETLISHLATPEVPQGYA